MELVMAAAIGVLTTCGVWLMLRPRTYQVIIGLCLLSYGVNLFIFSTGRLAVDSEPVLVPGVPTTFVHYTDPMPQALVLTAIVIGFATTGFIIELALRTRHETGTDHVDGEEAQQHAQAAGRSEGAAP